MSAAVVAAAGAGCAAALLGGGDRAARWLPREPVRSAGPRRITPASAPVLTVAGASLVVASVLGGLALPLLLTVALVAWATVRLAARASRERQRIHRRAQVADACEAMLGELRAGQPPSRAVDRATSVWPGLAPAARAARLGGDVPTALRELAALPGAGALGRLAGAWQLCGATGSGLAAALDQVLASTRAEHEVALAVRSELASARATARVLAVLPLLVLVMGQGIGARPWDFLLGTSGGQLCLLVGVGLALAGVMWLERIADEAQR